MLSELKTEVRSLFPYKFAVGTFSELKLLLKSIFNANVNEIFLLQVSYSYTNEDFPNRQLEVINLQCNDPLKGKHQEKNLKEFYKCLPSDEYRCL